MKITIENLQDTFKYGYEQFEDSREEAAEVTNLYHNRQYTADQTSTLDNRGQPKETFNVIKLFARMLLGYYSTVVNTVTANPVQRGDIDTALLMSDILKSIFHTSSFNTVGDKIKLSGLLAGLMIAFKEPVKTGRVDQFGRPIYKIVLTHVPDNEVVIDPSSNNDDYSDAGWIHRFKWVLEDKVLATFGQAAMDKLEAYHNHVDQRDSEFTVNYTDRFVGKYKVFDNYLIIHTNMVDDKGAIWSVFWSGNVILRKTKLTSSKFSYRVYKVHTSDKAEYYGLFREVVETQKAINQALIKFQLLVNTQKIFVQDGAVVDIDEFTTAVNRVSGIISVASLQGIKVQDLSRDALEQYVVIDKAFDRLQRILGINDSFLGNAFASDSGRKVKLQQGASIMSLRYLTGRIEQFYRLLGEDTAELVQRYYTAHQAIRIADEMVGSRWIELNKPLEAWSGEFDPDGNPIMEVQYEQVIDPEAGDPLIVDGNVIIAPIPETGSEISFTELDIEITSVSYNDQDEKNQLMLETTLSGNIGSLLSQVNPAGFFQAAALSVQLMQTKNSTEISEILTNTAKMLSGDKQASANASALAAGSSDASSQLSSQLKLPQNTNEGV